MKCPLCGGSVRDEPALGFLVCNGCCEILTHDETVRRATRCTRRRYERSQA